MDINRRAFVTGLAAAVAVAGVAPALSAAPAEAQPAVALIRSRLCFFWKPKQSRKFVRAAMNMAVASRWHVDIRGENDATYLHCDSGFFFAIYPERPGTTWLMVPADEPIFPIYHPGRMRVIGYAADIADANHFVLARDRRGRNGCFIVDFKDPDYKQLVTMDAPPLPRIESFANGTV